MNEESIKKQVDWVRDIKKHLWTGLIVAIGSTIGLSFNVDSKYKLFLVLIGFIISIIFFLSYFQKDLVLESLLSKLEKDEK